MPVRRSAAAPLLAILAVLASCGAPGGRPPVGAVRLGYVTELAQAAPLIAVREGLYKSALGTGVALRLATFTDDEAAAAALAAGTVDAAYLDPAAAYDVFSSSAPLRPVVTVVAGAASGGAMLVTRDTITTVAELRGRTIAVPGLGSAQNIALRTWLTSVSPDPGVAIIAVDSPDALAAFRNGAIDGAWLPEPWATRLVTDGGGRILVDERALWPGGAFSSSVLAVRTDFMNRNPEIVRRLIRGHVAAEDLVNTNPAMAQRDAGLEISALTGQDVTVAIPPAWTRMRFTDDPLVATLQEAADHAKPADVRRTPDLRGFVDVGSLNAILRARHRATVGQ